MEEIFGKQKDPKVYKEKTFTMRETYVGEVFTGIGMPAGPRVLCDDRKDTQGFVLGHLSQEFPVGVITELGNRTQEVFIWQLDDSILIHHDLRPSEQRLATAACEGTKIESYEQRDGTRKSL